MENDNLKQLEDIVSSDEFDRRSGMIAKKLREKWELAMAAENLGEHLVIKNIVTDLRQEVEGLNAMLTVQIVVTDEDKITRFKAQADVLAYQRIIDLFSGEQKKAVDQEINTALAKAKSQ